MTELAPGTTLVAIRDYSCTCGCTKLTEKAIYFCEEVVDDSELFVEIIPNLLYLSNPGCSESNCVGISVGLTGKQCYVCSAALKPLNDGDVSLVENEIEQPDVTSPQVMEPELV